MFVSLINIGLYILYIHVHPVCIRVSQDSEGIWGLIASRDPGCYELSHSRDHASISDAVAVCGKGNCMSGMAAMFFFGQLH